MDILYNTAHSRSIAPWLRADLVVPRFIRMILIVTAVAKILDAASYNVAVQHVFKPVGLESPFDFSLWLL